LVNEFTKEETVTVHKTRIRGMRPRHAGLLVIALGCLAVLAAACGGSSAASGQGAGDGSRGGSSGTSTAPDAVAYASCMRANGVSDFPDPRPNGGFLIPGNVAQSPNFDQAREKCAPLMPAGNTAGGQADPDAILEFARCMRANGVPDFPDPSPSAGGGLGTTAGGGGINTNSPAFQSAVQICGEKTGIQLQTRP
jgi:hypothetical protein